jgi:M6 family metalloprotease-like protein
MYLCRTGLSQALAILSCAVALWAQQLTAQQACSTIGVQNIAVLMVTFPGVSLPPAVTPLSVHDTFFGTTGHSLDGYWREASYGQTSATGDVFGTYTLSQSYTCSTGDQMLQEAMHMAAAQGANFLHYTRIFVIYPSIGCAAGFAQVGCSLLSTPSGSITASTAYIEADYMSGDTGVYFAVHEGGHNLGLQHAGTVDASPDVVGPLASGGTVSELGDNFSAMGSQTLGQYSAQHKAEILQWLAPATNYQVVQSSGIWSLQPIETSPAGLQALKIQRGTGNDSWLWVEYRQPIGNYDSTVYFQQPSGGAFIHYEDPGTGAFTHLLNFQPQLGSWYAPALLPGQTWSDPYSNVSISVQSATSNALTLGVTYGSVPCTHANPSVSASPLNPTTHSGGSVGYNVVVTNNDSTGCVANTFSLNSTQPSGWATTLSATSLTLSPGQRGTITMTKNAPASALAGVYAVDSSAAAGTFAASGLANVTITVPPALSVIVSTPSLIYSVQQTVAVTAMVLNGSSPATGVKVSFTLTLPGGGKVLKSMTADSTGTAVWNYKIGPKNPRGAYLVSASSTFSSQTATSNTASFTVQ